MSKLKHINKMASLYRHATLLTNINHNLFICILISLLLPTAFEGASAREGSPNVDESGRRLTREYHLRQGALRGLIVKPTRLHDLQAIEMFLGIPYAAPPVGNLRFMPTASAPPWPGVRLATRFAPVCPQFLPPIKKGNPPSLGRQTYRSKLEGFLKNESEDCLYLNIYVPYREQKTKKFPILVFIHGDSFEWSSGNPYDGRILSSYGNVMVITINYRLGVLGFLQPSLTDYDYGNNGLVDQLAALQWIKDNVEDLNGDPGSVTLMGHGTGAASVSYLMLSPISNDLFHRAILMSGSALSDWAMTKDPTQYTLQVAQGLGCDVASKNLMTCLQSKPLSEIKRIQILSRDFETPLGPTVTGSFIPNEPARTMEIFPDLLSRYQLLCGVTELERYHDFGVIELDHGVLDTQRDEFITKYAKVAYDTAENVVLKEVLKQYTTSKEGPQHWSVETNRDVILNAFSDARTLAPMIRFANYQSKANRQSYFYVFGHNSVSTDYAYLNKSVNGEELPYIFGVPLGGTHTHFHSDYTLREKLLSEVMMRLWTNFVKIGTPNTQSLNKYYAADKKTQNQFIIDWPEYNVEHQSYLRLDIPPRVSSFYRSNYTAFWIDDLPTKLKRYIVDPYDYSPPSTQRPKSTPKSTDHIQRPSYPQLPAPPPQTSHYVPPNYGRVRSYSPPAYSKPDIYNEIRSIDVPARRVPSHVFDKPKPTEIATIKPDLPDKQQAAGPVKTSSATIALIISLGILFLLANIGICGILYYRRKKSRNRNFESNPRAELGDVDLIGRKSLKEDKGAIKTLKNGCSVIKSINIGKIKNGSQNSKKAKPEPCKTPKSDDSGGFRERFQLRRHLSTSTLDAHSKVREWIANDTLNRCAPSNLQTSNSDLVSHADSKHVPINCTRSEELLSESKINKEARKTPDSLDKKSTLQSKKSNVTRTSDKTTLTSAMGSHSSIDSNKHSTSSIKTANKSTDSLKSKDSSKSKKVSVAIDATPAARTNSILNQEPIELTKSIERSETTTPKHSIENYEKSKTEGDVPKEIKQIDNKTTDVNDGNKTFTSAVSLSIISDRPLKISHKHSTSDPVTDVNYGKTKKDKVDSAIQVTDLLPPLSFRNDINVTSRDEQVQVEPLSAAEALLTIKRRNFPKVLPDLPKAQKRLSLQPSSLQTFRSYSSSTENPPERPKVPPQPPPRTTTLERRLAYKNSKPSLSSFETSPSKISGVSTNLNYENIDTLAPQCETAKSLPRSFESTLGGHPIYSSSEKTVPKVIIAANPNMPEPKIIIQPSQSQVSIPSNAPRVRLPDDFHSHTSGSITSFSSFADENESDDDEDFLEELGDDKLLQELVGGVESPTELEDMLDTKGPDINLCRKLEIVPVKLNPGTFVPKNSEDYVCISNLLLPDVSEIEHTARIKPNFGLSKLQQRSDSINRPAEKAVKLKQRKSIRPSALLSKSSKAKDKSKNSAHKIEHSTSGSSNDTETSTGTVKRVNIAK